MTAHSLYPGLERFVLAVASRDPVALKAIGKASILAGVAFVGFASFLAVTQLCGISVGQLYGSGMLGLMWVVVFWHSGGVSWPVGLLFMMMSIGIAANALLVLYLGDAASGPVATVATFGVALIIAGARHLTRI